MALRDIIQGYVDALTEGKVTMPVTIQNLMQFALNIDAAIPPEFTLYIDSPLSGAGTSGDHLKMAKATSLVDGYLSKEDWSTFNNKLSSLSGAVLTDQSTPQTIGTTLARLSKLWATDLAVTNAIVAGGASLSASETITISNLTTATADGLNLIEDTVTTNIVTVRYSPRMKWRGRAWDLTGAGSDKYVDWAFFVEPVSAAGISSYFRLANSINGAAFTNKFTFYETGRFDCTFFVASSTCTVSVSGMTTTVKNGLSVNSGDAASVGTPVRYSPALQQQGKALETGTNTPKSIEFRQYVLPVSGNPVTGSLVWDSLLTGGSLTTRMQLFETGQLNIEGNKRVACGGGSSGTQTYTDSAGNTTTFNTITLEINGTSKTLLCV